MTDALTVYQDWVERAYAASMDYLKRDPRCSAPSPRARFPAASR